MCKYRYSLSHSENAMVHSGKVWAVQLGPRPKICIATFFTGFRVDTNFCSLIDKRKIKLGILQFARAEHDSKKKKKKKSKLSKKIRDRGVSRVQLVWRLRVMVFCTVYCLAQRKLRVLKFCRKEERCFEWSNLIK